MTSGTKRGAQDADISVYHARTADARIAMTVSGILMVIYSCRAGPAGSIRG